MPFFSTVGYLTARTYEGVFSKRLLKDGVYAQAVNIGKNAPAMTLRNSIQTDHDNINYIFHPMYSSSTHMTTMMVVQLRGG